MGPIPYRRRDRSADRRQGHRDGRRHIPSYTSLMEMLEEGARITAPYPESLASLGRYHMNQEYLAYEQRCVEPRRRIARLEAERVAAQEAIERAELEVTAAQAPLSEEDLLPRNPGELSQQGTLALLSRRAGMQERRIALARAELARRISVLDDLNGQLAIAQEQIRRELAVAVAEARRLGDYFALRATAYWEGVASAHPEGRQLALLLPLVTPVLPRWAEAPQETGAAGDDAVPPNMSRAYPAGDPDDGQETP